MATATENISVSDLSRGNLTELREQRHQRTKAVLEKFDAQVADDIFPNACAELGEHGSRRDSQDSRAGADAHVHSIIKIQSIVRAFLARKAFAKLLLQKVLDEQAIEDAKNKSRVDEGLAMLESLRVQKEMEDQETLKNQRKMLKNRHASIIQMAWRRYKFEQRAANRPAQPSEVEASPEPAKPAPGPPSPLSKSIRTAPQQATGSETKEPSSIASSIHRTLTPLSSLDGGDLGGGGDITDTPLPEPPKPTQPERARTPPKAVEIDTFEVDSEGVPKWLTRDEISNLNPTVRAKLLTTLKKVVEGRNQRFRSNFQLTHSHSHSRWTCTTSTGRPKTATPVYSGS